MIIQTTNQIPSVDLERFGWTGLRRFHNVELVSALISKLHNVSAGNQNVTKQATQIRYCLQQAREYFDSAKYVSLVTKPVLLYYSIMCLALSEILLKQDGNSSLDRARGEHKHHGLVFDLLPVQKRILPLSDHGVALRAQPARRPVNRSSQRFGTFELWHRSCRLPPLAGTLTEFTAAGLSLTRFATVLTQDDERLPLLPDAGITLLDCLRLLPGMQRILFDCEITRDFVRATLTATLGEGRPPQTQILIHPADKSAVDEFMSNISFNANEVDRVNVHEAHVGGIVYLTDLTHHCDIPPGVAIDTKNTYFHPRRIPLNEFGIMYVALFICSNYARYYPDYWIRDVDHHAPLALAVEQLIDLVENRMALLTLSEFSRIYLVPEP